MLRRFVIAAVSALAIATGAVYAPEPTLADEFPELQPETFTSQCSDLVGGAEHNVRAYNGCLDAAKPPYYSSKAYWKLTTPAQHTPCLKWAEQQKQAVKNRRQRETNYEPPSEVAATIHYYESLSACLQQAYESTVHQW
jgi:hypothetical protein